MMMSSALQTRGAQTFVRLPQATVASVLGVRSLAAARNDRPFLSQRCGWTSAGGAVRCRS